jgi:hypothetical protein
LTDEDTEALTRKLADEDLLELARTGRRQSVNVIVELNVPRTEVQLEPDRSGIGMRPAGVGASDQRLIELRQEIAEQAEAMLRGLTGEEPVRLPGGSSLGVRIDSDRLDAVVRSPLVRRVHLSRLRRSS